VAREDARGAYKRFIRKLLHSAANSIDVARKGHGCYLTLDIYPCDASPQRRAKTLKNLTQSPETRRA
jgi:hypothetical protein